MNFFKLSGSMIFNLDAIVRVITHKDDNNKEIYTIVFSDSSRLTLFAESLVNYFSFGITKGLFDSFIDVYKRAKEIKGFYTNITIIDIPENHYQYLTF